jgi:hypothetical protein
MPGHWTGAGTRSMVQAGMAISRAITVIQALLLGLGLVHRAPGLRSQRQMS